MFRCRKASLLIPLCLISLSTHAFEVVHKGQFRARQEHYDIIEGRPDKKDFTTMRLRMGFEVQLSEDRKVFFSPQAVKTYGESGTSKEYAGEVSFHEAYADVPLAGFRFKAGRQAVVYGEQRLFGSRNWIAEGQSFDGFKLSRDVFSGNLDLGYLKIANTKTAQFADDISLVFLYYKMINSSSHELDTYVLRNNDSALASNNDTITGGFRYKLKGSSWNLETENIFQENETTKNSAYHLNLVADVTLGKLKTFVKGFVASRSYDQLYANRHSHHGDIDIVGRQNLAGASIGGLYNFNEKWNLKAEFFQFRRASKSAPGYRQDGTTALPGDQDDLDLGQEVDLALTYKPRAKESINLTASAFMHGSYFARENTSTFIFAQYGIQF